MYPLLCDLWCISLQIAFINHQCNCTLHSIWKSSIFVTKPGCFLCLIITFHIGVFRNSENLWGCMATMYFFHFLVGFGLMLNVILPTVCYWHYWPNIFILCQSIWDQPQVLCEDTQDLRGCQRECLYLPCSMDRTHLCLLVSQEPRPLV